MFRYLVLIPMCLVSMTLGNFVSAGHHGRGCAVCPRCETYCEFTAEEAMEENTCWQIECEEICVPRVVFPWQTKKARHHSRGNCCNACTTGCGVCTCVNNGAWVKTIKKLKKHTYECPACKYEWTPKKMCGCGPCGGGNCGACCADGTYDAGGVEPWQDQDTMETPVEAEEPEAPSIESAERTPLPSPFLGVSGKLSGVKARLATLKQPFLMFKKSDRK